LTLPWQHPEAYSAFHLYVIRLNLNEIRLSHRAVFEALRGAGIGVNLHYIPVYLQQYYRDLGFTAGYCPQAEHYYREAISIPMYQGLKHEDQEYVIETIRQVLR
jgi:dTDP-4-amino-4,6-dideoxygalactose transaminase